MYLTKQTIIKNKKIYDDFYSSGIQDGWADHNKEYNFKQLFKIRNYSGESFKDKTILDVGCGTADIVPYLNDFGIKKYVGIDIYLPALKIARKKYKQLKNFKFIQTDILKNKNMPNFDFIFASGSLTTNIYPKDNYQFFSNIVQKMWNICNIGIAFNILNKKTTEKDNYIFYYNVDNIKKILYKIVNNKGLVIIKNTPLKNKNKLEERQKTIYLIKI